MNHPLSGVYFVKKLLYENGFGNVWETKAAHISHPMFIRQFEQRLKDTFMQSCFSDMENSNTCLLYRSLCRELSIATYLCKIHIPANTYQYSLLNSCGYWTLNKYYYYY